jgi:hypothetical protein
MPMAARSEIFSKRTIAKNIAGWVGRIIEDLDDVTEIL